MSHILRANFTISFDKAGESPPFPLCLSELKLSRICSRLPLSFSFAQDPAAQEKSGAQDEAEVIPAAAVVNLIEAENIEPG